MTTSNVFSSEFIQAVTSKLEALPAGAYLPRGQLCAELGLPAEFASIISLMLDSGMLPGYVAVKSRGIKKVPAPLAVAA